MWLRDPKNGETHLSAPFFLTGGVPFQWGPALRSDAIFGLSSWTFAACGVVIAWLGPALADITLPWWPWRLEGSLLIAMSFISRVADVTGVDRLGLAHVADRLLATFLSVMFAFRIFYLLDRMDEVQIVLGILGVASAAFTFAMKRRAAKQENLAEYRLWTVLWHICFPFLGMLWFFYTLGRARVAAAF